MNYSRFCYVGDFGQAKISDKTLQAYEVSFLTNGDVKWRRSSTKRAKVAEFYGALAAVQKYHWLRGEELGEL